MQARGITPLEAQQRGGPGGGRGPTVDEQVVALTDALALTDEQAVSVRAVLETATERRQEMFAGGPPDDREAMRAAMMQLREDTDTQLEEILSEDQMEKYTELMAQQRQRRGPPF